MMATRSKTKARSPAPRPRKMSKRAVMKMLYESGKIHEAFWAVQKAIGFDDATQKYTKRGFDAMSALRRALPRLQKRWPDQIWISAVDDAAHAGSMLCFVAHASAKQKRWHGITVFYFAQCTGEMPTSFFLYDDHRREMIRALHSIGRCRKIYPKDDA